SKNPLSTEGSTAARLKLDQQAARKDHIVLQAAANTLIVVGRTGVVIANLSSKSDGNSKDVEQRARVDPAAENNRSRVRAGHKPRCCRRIFFPETAHILRRRKATERARLSGETSRAHAVSETHGRIDR